MRYLKIIVISLFLIPTTPFVQASLQEDHKKRNATRQAQAYEQHVVPTSVTTALTKQKKRSWWSSIKRTFWTSDSTNQSTATQPSAPSYWQQNSGYNPACNQNYQVTAIAMAEVLPAGEFYSKSEVCKMIEKAKRETASQLQIQNKKEKREIAVVGLGIGFGAGLAIGVMTTILIMQSKKKN